MKGKIFSIDSETPCPACGTSRYGIDADDDYFIAPGLAINADCTCRRCHKEKVPFGPFSAPDQELECPDCGHPLQWERIFQNSFPGSSYRPTCRRIELREGCPSCSQSYSWAG